jgi:hypothetical protein
MLLDSLHGIRRKVRLLGILHGLGIVVAAVVGLLLSVLLLDYLLNLPAVPRVALMAASVGLLGYAAFRFVIRPLLARLSLSDVAGRLEHAFPQFDDRLRSTVDFLGKEIPGSDAMKERVVSEAGILARDLKLDRAVVARPAYLSMAGGVGALLVALLLILVVNQSLLQIALSRLLTPFNGLPWPKRVQIELLSSPQARVPVGERLDVRMRLARGDKSSMKSVVFYQYDDGPVQQELMERAADGTYASSLDARIEPNQQAATLKIWMKAGDDRVNIDPITVVPRLAIRSVHAVIVPPPYVANRAESTVDLASAPAVMAAGSEIALRVAFNKPLAAQSTIDLVPVTPDAELPKIEWTQLSPTEAHGRWIARSSLRFHLRATDTDSFANNALEEFELIVRPDQTPSVQIENPRRNEERTAVSVVPLQGLAEDDYGIQWLKLVVDRPSDKKHWEVLLVENGQPASQVGWTRAEGAGDRIRFRANFQWDLATLADAKLKSGDVLEYHLLAKDNYALEGATHDPVASGRLRITIISQEDLASRVIDELRQVKNQITEVKSGQDRLRQETESLKEETKDKPQLDQADRAAAERLTNHQATAASQAKQLAGKVDQIQSRLEENKSPSQDLRDIARDVKSDLNQAAENPMKEATNQLTQAAQPKSDPRQRGQSLDKAQQNQQQASEQLNRALERMANIGSLEQTIASVKQLLEEQQKTSGETREIGKENLGKKPEEMKAEDRQRLNKNAQDQQNLADKTQKALEQMQKLSEQMKRSDPTSAEAMEKAARTGQQQQVSPNQRKAAEQARQNQQAGAQAAQKQAELGLELILNELREAERAKLAELSKKLEELQNQVANLIRRQAGHNLDNLANQGPQRIAKLDQAFLSDLLTKSERDKGVLPAIPKIEQLSPAQEQTERNTRDMAKTAEALPNGAEPAAHLTRAASRMERAIVSLRDRQLADAYEPPQVEALAALEAAKKIIDEQKDKVDEQIADKDKEAVRQKYVKIKEAQEKLNAETARIDSARDPAGQLQRPDAIRLGQLPGEQGRLADDTNKLGEDLAAVGSTVYIWANKDIVQSMNDVKSELGKAQSGVETQAEQTRIVEQLDAMIRNLAIKPKESKFAAEGGGGGGGGQAGGGPQLPTEAELRLLQDLQRAVNKSTKTIDAQPNKDKNRLMALGNRQGEMRQLLDDTLQKASRGEIKLGPEPDNRDQLPEEAKVEDVENQELDKDLLSGLPDDEKNEAKAERIGDRMARSRQRLAINNDPGKTTQIIQERILEDFDFLIDQARQQQAQVRNSPSQAQRQNQPRPGEQQAQAQNQGQNPGQPRPNRGNNPAEQSNPPGAGDPTADLSRDIRESSAEWGQISPRLPEAVIEGSSEKIIAEYQKLIEDYYKSVSTKANER